eukprot:TRINITY_DN19373_c0_g1_i5.p1 TRINITY_DN19373_c0_g1~~TRINITY_DN19373_c0_g1_i5.p1  ORF type:complete len:174 (+),score=41.79 TRINITY_DN19373_c0_g1_i5:240-761(+)
MMCAGCIAKMDWQFNPHLPGLTTEFLGSILDNMVADKIEWLPYGNPRMTYEQNALPSFHAGNGGVTVLLEARRTSDLAATLEGMALQETSEQMQEEYDRLMGKQKFETGVLLHLYMAQDADGKMDQLWDYHPHDWLNSIEDTWKGTYFHLTKTVDQDGNVIFVAEEQQTDVGW